MTKAKFLSVNRRKASPSLIILMLTVQPLQCSEKPFIYSLLPVVDSFSRLKKKIQHCTTRYIIMIQIANVPIFPCPLMAQLTVYFPVHRVLPSTVFNECLQIYSKQLFQSKIAGFCLFCETCVLTHTIVHSYSVQYSNLFRKMFKVTAQFPR